MSVRREVLSLSQLLRRNENSRKSHRGTGRAPPLPLQTSRHRAGRSLPAENINSGVRHARSEPFTERPTRSEYPSISFTQRDNRVSTSQPEIDATNQTNNSFTVLLQDAYEVESQQSAVTSMSQSSFSQTQSQNLLSQDDQILRTQRWQAQQVPSQTPLTSAHCSSTEKLRDLELNLTKAFHEQTNKQEQQQHELMMRLASPVKKSVEEIKAKLVTSSEDQQQLGAAIEKLTKRVDSVGKSVKELRQQSPGNNAAYKEIHKIVTSEAAAVKAALKELRARVDTVEGSVKSCSRVFSKAHQGEASNQEALLSAVAASSCKCIEETIRAEDFSDANRTLRKRQRSSRPNVAENNPASYRFSPPVDRPSTRTRTQSPPRYAARITAPYDSDDAEMVGRSLDVSLQRIQSLLDKRRQYLHDF
ncbi:hypothetical protein V7S43_013868 [Phytophthora oleae]|uniref:Uncharacterized protein n=1 Tax=Phytophthora oleae TaxID=2107226 RepID=A0ABD3F362_9STRA